MSSLLLSNEFEVLRRSLNNGQVDDSPLKLLQKMCAHNSFNDINNFLEIARLVMKAGITGSDSLKEAAGKMRLQQTIASKGGSEHANFLCDLGIVENAIKMLELLHVNRLDKSGKNERIILTIWSLFRDILKKSSKGRTTFIKGEGLHWMSWYTCKYPIHKSQQLQMIMEDLVETLEPNVKEQDIESWKSCLEFIRTSLKRIV